MNYYEIKITERDTSSEGLNSLIKKIEKAAKTHASCILLNMSGISAINSGAIGVIIRKHKDLKLAGSGISLSGLSESLTKICENSGLLRLVPLYQHTE
jgi:anti-anti-sigma factor